MSYRLPAEFEQQSFIQIIFPHAQSDWVDYLEAASNTFATIATTIARFQQCLVICDDVARVKSYFNNNTNLIFIQADTNDTWARDCSAITTIDAKTSQAKVLDFTFTGWGNKFEADLDNALTQHLSPHYNAIYQKERFILEGGAIDSNGKGLLLTTKACVLNPNRNIKLTHKHEIESIFRTTLGVKKTLWLESGYLAGDDTDSHIDTLVRFVNENTVVYVQCDDKNDEHYDALHQMQEQLKTFTDTTGAPLNLVPLPMCNPIYYDKQRLPATYANFLIINGAVLVPTYNDTHDKSALAILKTVFPSREVIGIDCSILIRQHGSLHCVTMQFPSQVALI